jgi:CDP-diacylglycerol--serine O-phosphatidyltransferase
MANCITKLIPNTLTSLNVFSGCLAIIFGYEGEFELAACCIAAGTVFDFFDGMSARLLGVNSPLGKELDSLADMTTFGIAPAMMVYSMLYDAVPYMTSSETLITYVPLAAFLLAIFSALRLAKFNIDERQTTSFIGLPTPANALFWIGFSLAYTDDNLGFLGSPVVILLLVCLMSWLLVSEVPMFSFKFKDLSWAHNRVRYIFLPIAVASLALLGAAGLAVVIILYVITSLLTRQRKQA